MTEILNTRAILHQPLLRHWEAEVEKREQAQHNRKTRFERYVNDTSRGRVRGDVILKRLYDVFNHGMGRRWSATQQLIFKAFVDTALPKIYGDEWEEVKVRVMRERGLDKHSPWALVNMARRNGKTFVTAGTAAAFILVIPNLSVAIFSTGIRASQMLRDTLNDMIEGAFAAGTHVRREQYRVLQKNKEVYIMEHPNGGKQVIGCYPGSVRVSSGFLFLHGGGACSMDHESGVKQFAARAVGAA